MRIGLGDFWLGDCFDLFARVPDGSVDMVLCDLPYGTTQNKWDSVLPLDRLWAEYWRVAKPNAAIVLTAAAPFDKVLACSQLGRFKYEWIWEKTAATGFLNAKKEPLRAHETVLVFGNSRVPYNPRKSQGPLLKRVNESRSCHGTNYGKKTSIRLPYESTERYPRSVLLFPKDNRIGRPHPTQKPVALFEYLIRTYTNPGELVLDNTAGSGTTAIAAENAGRRWICMERDEGYYNAAICRVLQHTLNSATPDDAVNAEMRA